MRESDKEARRREGGRRVFSSSRAASRESAPLLTSGCHRSVQNILPRKSAKCLQNLLKDFLGAVERWGNLTASRSGHFQAERPDCVQAGTAGGRGGFPEARPHYFSQPA